MDWPHAPVHRLGESGAYMVTSGTYRKEPYFKSAQRLDFLQSTLFTVAARHEWNLQAWAIFPNHYHFVALAPEKPQTLRALIRQLHSMTAIEANRRDNTPERKVWFEYWDSLVSNAKSYFARLSYVHHNAVRHGLVRLPAQYPWCSAAWLERKASRSFFRTVMEFPHSRVKLPDDFRIDSSHVAD